MKHWVEVLGVGPFFYIEEAPIQNFRYRGEPSDMVASIALANSGPLQIELSEISGPKGKTFKMIAEKSRNWDGTNPIRTIRT